MNSGIYKQEKETKKIPARKKGKQVLLQGEKLRKAFGGQVVLDNVSLTVYREEVIMLRGNNGSGKTTLLNILTGNLAPDAGTIQLFTNSKPETFYFPKHWWQNLNPFDHFVPERIAWSAVGRTWQDIHLFSTLSVMDNIAIATPGQTGENPLWAIFLRSRINNQERQIRSRTKTTLMNLGLEGRDHAFADMISLGQAKRVAIARAIQAGARILFLDEPLAALDMHGIVEVLELLKQLAYKKNITLVIVEHILNIPRILNLADTVWTLSNGKLTVEDSDELRINEECVVSNNMAPVINSLRSPLNVKSEKGDEMFQTMTTAKDIYEWPKKIFGSNAKIINQKLPGDALLSTITPADTKSGENMLSIENLVVQRGKRFVIGKKDNGQYYGLSFTLHKGQLAILEAPNGWGKTTLLEAISGLLPVKQGLIKLNGHPVQGLPPWERAKRGISFLQAYKHTFPGLTVREALHLAEVNNIPYNVNHVLNKRVSDLSGGEKQIVSMICATQGRDFCIGLFDEPFSKLDSGAITHFLSILVNLMQNTGILLAVPKFFNLCN